jgi:hypothetical protein
MDQRTLPAGFIAPCLPTKAHEPPSGGLWLHEIKHDGFRIIACKSAESIFLYAFDLIELNCDDMRRDPLEVRKATLRSMLAKVGLGLRFNEHLEGDGSTVFRPRLSTNEDELGHGWVAVGHLNSERYSDVNFNVPPNARERDGTIKPHEIIRARWSVTLRSNSHNLEDRQGYTRTSLGLLWGGECAKVIDSRLDGRLQTWAFIEIVQCPLTTKSDPGFERRAMSGVRSLIR